MSHPPQQSGEHDRRIDYIELSVTDVETAKQFYGETFGWALESWGADYASFKDGRIGGGFTKVNGPVGGGAHPPLVILFAVDLEGLEARVRKAGGKIVKEIFSFPGGRRFHFTDPSGNELAVWSDRPAP